MHLRQLTLRRFRNLTEVDVEFAERITVIHGDNGQGKTNLLEGIYFLATLKPLRGSRLADLVQLGQESAEVGGTVVEEVSTRLTIRIADGRRESKVDGKTPASVEAWAAHLKVVAFTPDDLDIAKGPPATRRGWIDRAAFNRQPVHLKDHRLYTHALKARNRLLRDDGSDDELDAFDQAVASAGAALVERRLALLEELRPRVGALYRAVTGTQVELEMTYTSDAAPEEGWPADRDAIAATLLESLDRRRRLDRARGHTTRGPHADDVALRLDGRDVRIFGSQGQQRATVLSLKIAEIENLEAENGRFPLLLLDDVSSELDPRRNAHLLTYLAAFRGQVVLTTTDPAHAPVPDDVEALLLSIDDGRIRV